MKSVRVLEEEAAPPDPAFDVAAYGKTLFDMAPGELRWCGSRLTGGISKRY
ncbi:MAG: hypothetical protein R2912_09890 [Eubacteriales bacterium]